MNILNCKPGDLAFVVRAKDTPGLVGYFVIVERMIVCGEYLNGRRILGATPTWMVSSAVAGSTLPTTFADGTLSHWLRRPIADKCLRPIRPNEGEDEAMSWSLPKVGELA